MHVAEFHWQLPDAHAYNNPTGMKQGTPALPGSQPGVTVQLKQGSATLSTPQHSGTRPSSWTWQHPEQTEQVPKPCALAGYPPSPKLGPFCGWTGGIVDLEGSWTPPHFCMH